MRDMLEEVTTALTMQEMFDKLAVHLFKQGKQSLMPITNSDGLHKEICAYRGENHLMCGVGIFITDEEYDMGMEQQGVSRLMGSYKHISDKFAHINVDFLSAIQVVHDNPENWRTTANMRDALLVLSRPWRLEPNIIYTLHFGDR